MKKIFSDYYLGLDAGSDSVGWAVTDENYNILKFNGKSLWGIRLFDEGQSAEERRMFRTARRRQGRRVQRTKLLQELFSEEICKVDQSFYQRMADSKFLIADKAEKQMNALFNDENYNDKIFYRNYPTIYHLRKAFLDGEKITDVRLLYLAVHHIISNRGHFLFESLGADNIPNSDELFSALNTYLSEECDSSLPISNIAEIKDCIKAKSGITVKKKKLRELLEADTDRKKAIADLLAGASGIKLCLLFEDNELKDAEINKVSFSSSQYDENYDALSDELQDRIILIDYLKAIYDWGILADILNDCKYISHAKVKIYNKHHNDLMVLKKVVRRYSPNKYNDVFKSPDIENNYCAYAGLCKKNGKKAAVKKKCSQEDFCKYISGILKNADNSDEDVKYIFSELENNTLLPKQTSKNNSVIPYQINLSELQKILKNASANFSFLSMRDESGYTVSEKIIKLLTFRIPYYVGPLNDAHKENGNCWIVKKSNEPITPWNFESVVDLHKSSEAFITRMTNKCTYLVGEDVLPKNSLLYSEFTVLNELNNLKINGEPISAEDKKQIFDEVFKRKANVKLKDIVSFFKRQGQIVNLDDLSGTDGDFKSSYKSYYDFARILGNRFDTQNVEEAVRAITIFGNDKKMLSSKLKSIGNGYFSDEEIKQICKLKYSDWGRISEKFFTEIYDIDKSTGECVNIITMLRDTNENLMQLLGNKYGFKKACDEYNKSVSCEVESFSYETLVKDLYVSPKVKRSIWQILVIMREIEKITGHAPKRIFVEMAREDGEKKRTITRKEKLLELYKSCKSDTRDWSKEIAGHTDGDLRRDALYLYYTQMGRCMYSGEPIDLDELFNKKIYDIDHIYPQSKTKDDSLDNRVLVKRTLNEKKSDLVPIPDGIVSEDARKLWYVLKEKGLISSEKYNRLTRKTDFSADELSGFIARQLVETRQSTKAAAELLQKMYPASKIVYSKATNVDVFKKKYHFIKVREVNDFHHAKDAYFNIVVGNVFYTKFTDSPYNFVKNKEKYSLNECMYDYNIERNGVCAWKAGNNGTIALVKKTVAKNNILHTRYSFEVKGGLFDQQIMRKGLGQMPIKSSDSRLTIENYGGYNKISGAYYILVEHGKKDKRIRTIEYVPVYLAKKIEENPCVLDDYVNNTLKLIEPDIRLRKIKSNALFNYNGYLMNITGRGDVRLLFQGAVELILDDSSYAYTKKIVKFKERMIKSRGVATVTSFDEITAEDNLKLYDVFLDKLKNTIYNVAFDSQVKTIEMGRLKFVDLSVENQVAVLFEMLHFFQCNCIKPDLSLIGGAHGIIKNRISKNITNCEKMYYINKSPTGVFEQVIDLKTV